MATRTTVAASDTIIHTAHSQDPVTTTDNELQATLATLAHDVYTEREHTQRMVLAAIARNEHAQRTRDASTIESISTTDASSVPPVSPTADPAVTATTRTNETSEPISVFGFAWSVVKFPFEFAFAIIELVFGILVTIMSAIFNVNILSSTTAQENLSSEVDHWKQHCNDTWFKYPNTTVMGITITTNDSAPFRAKYQQKFTDKETFMRQVPAQLERALQAAQGFASQHGVVKIEMVFGCISNQQLAPDGTEIYNIFLMPKSYSASRQSGGGETYNGSTLSSVYNNPNTYLSTIAPTWQELLRDH